MNVVVDNFRVVALRVAEHSLHQFGSLQALDITGPVIDIGRGHQLPTLFYAGNYHGIEIGPSRIDRCRVSGRTRAQNQNAAMLQVTHV